MQENVSLAKLVGRYQIKREGNNYRNEDDDLHIISVDPEEQSAFMDFSASPEWVPVTFDENGNAVLDGKFLLNHNEMFYVCL